MQMKILCALLLASHLICEENEKGYLPLGNLALPLSQLPNPLVSFGENTLNKGQLQLYLYADASIGKDSYSTDVIPSMLYGIRDDLSLFINVPMSPGNKSGNSHSAGLEDLFIQLEYTFYERTTLYALAQATLVGNVTFPTGSASKNPSTGFGSSSFFIGATYSHLGTDWFFFVSPGGVVTTSNDGTKFGDQILYQWGLGRNIPSPSGWIFALLLEFDGLYAWKNTIHGMTNRNSGGNTIYVTPSIWISSERIILQMGVGYPIVQHLFGDQPRGYVSFDFNLGYTF